MFLLFEKKPNVLSTDELSHVILSNILVYKYSHRNKSSYTQYCKTKKFHVSAISVWIREFMIMINSGNVGLAYKKWKVVFCSVVFPILPFALNDFLWTRFLKTAFLFLGVLLSLSLQLKLIVYSPSAYFFSSLRIIPNILYFGCLNTGHSYI